MTSKKSTEKLTPEQLKCTLCPFQGTHKRNLIKHFKTQHKGENPYKCDAEGCDYATHTKHHLTMHVNIKHKGLRPYPCHMCSYK